MALVHASAPIGGTVSPGTEVNILPAAIEAVRSRGGPSSIFSQVPSPDQRRCRPYTVFQFTNRSGRSRHGHPVRVRKKIPTITSL